MEPHRDFLEAEYAVLLFPSIDREVVQLPQYLNHVNVGQDAWLPKIINKNYSVNHIKYKSHACNYNIYLLFSD